MMRRAVAEAEYIARERWAFGKQLQDMQLMKDWTSCACRPTGAHHGVPDRGYADALDAGDPEAYAQFCAS